MQQDDLGIPKVISTLNRVRLRLSKGQAPLRSSELTPAISALEDAHTRLARLQRALTDREFEALSKQPAKSQKG